MGCGSLGCAGARGVGMGCGCSGLGQAGFSYAAFGGGAAAPETSTVLSEAGEWIGPASEAPKDAVVSGGFSLSDIGSGFMSLFGAVTAAAPVVMGSWADIERAKHGGAASPGVPAGTPAPTSVAKYSGVKASSAMLPILGIAAAGLGAYFLLKKRR